MKEISLNKHGVNTAIKFKILDDSRMREVGFTDFKNDTWYFSKQIKFPNKRRYDDVEMCFTVSIPKNGDENELRIDILDDNFCQPYDYQAILIKTPAFEPSLIVKEQVEEWMDYLQTKGVLSGRVYGEYI